MNIIATVGGRPRVYRLDCQAITARLHTSHRDEVFQKSLIALSSWHTDESRGGWQAVRGSHPRGGSFGLGRFPATSTSFAGHPTAVDLLSGTSSDSFRAPDGCTSTRPMVSYRILGKLTVGSSADSRGPRTGRRLLRPRTFGMQSGTSPPIAASGWTRMRPHGAIAWTGPRTVTFSHLVRTRVPRSTTRSAMNGCTNLPVWNGTSEASHGLTPEPESRRRT